MKTALFFTFLLSMPPAQAWVLDHSVSRLSEARRNNLISSETLIVKIKRDADFAERNTHLGEFEPFFETAEGSWGYLKLNMTPDAVNARFVLKDLSLNSDVIHAYYAPVPKNATLEADPVDVTVEVRNYVETPDFEHKQNYLNDAPVGVGARSAWSLPGGTGRNVRVIDIETCFNDSHEDFDRPFWVGGNPTCDSSHHGTAVWGEIAAKRDGKGVTGIAHEADFGIYGFLEGDWEEVNDQYIKNINIGIQGAMKELTPGDVLVIEQQMVGPELDKYTAVEFWPHIFDQLKAVTKKGVHCVQAAGNGESNFDDPSYDGAFNLKKRDSGCIMVGAIDPVTRERLSFSNYGTRLDAAAFGRGVMTTGYGHFFNEGQDRMYTDRFSGTSSATPIVAGAVAVVSSIAKEQKKKISPGLMRSALRASGLKQGPQTSAKRVGNLPVIQQLIQRLRLKK